MFSLFFENLKISLSAVFANKMRSILTALGIVIGVLSVTLMGTLISGLDRSFENSMSWLGKDILYISRYEWFSDMEWWEIKNRPRMRTEYVDKIIEKSKYALAVSPVMQRTVSLSYKDKETIVNNFMKIMEKIIVINKKATAKDIYELNKILFDYQFFSTGANSLDKKFIDFVDIKKSYSQSCLTFKVSLRGNCEKRAYEIFRREGPLALLPLEKNLYQVIWTSSTLKSIERLNSDKNFLMDNLSTKMYFLQL